MSWYSKQYVLVEKWNIWDDFVVEYKSMYLHEWTQHVITAKNLFINLLPSWDDVDVGDYMENKWNTHAYVLKKQCSQCVNWVTQHT
jgi:hypothetical protein